MAENLIYHNSRWRYALLTLGGLAFVAMGVFMIITEGKWGLGLVSIAFFGTGVLVGIRQLLDSRPRLQITEEGILDRTLGVGLIPWADIDDAYVRSINQENFICLVLHNEDEYLQRLPPLKRKLASANAALGFTMLSVNLSGVDLNPEQLLEYILKQSAAAQMHQS
ncbi:STM3941 family protein [Hymenobacter sp. UYP22]|uniref:STM3941 family protein n=1 Tax=Hymenobacter sp. UYP22 TaxID=3156348 RepID=UPI0033979DD7